MRVQESEKESERKRARKSMNDREERARASVRERDRQSETESAVCLSAQKLLNVALLIYMLHVPLLMSFDWCPAPLTLAGYAPLICLHNIFPTYKQLVVSSQALYWNIFLFISSFFFPLVEYGGNNKTTMESNTVQLPSILPN